MSDTATVAEVRRIISAGDLRTVFQPIVDLQTREILAYEALSRGPVGSVAEMPDTLFAVAGEEGLTSALDRACVAASLSAGRSAGIGMPLSLFVNVEAKALSHFAELLPLDQVVVVEITERDLLEDLGLLLRSAARLRAAGLKIAMDDVGSDLTTLALLPLLQPDIIKLDMSLLQKQPSRHTAHVMDAVSTYQEEFNAVVVAEGVETEEHLLQARAFGATLGQGWLFGKPSSQAPSSPPPGIEVRTFHSTELLGSTPFTIAEQFRTPLASTEPMLLQESQFLESSALDGDRATLVFSTFQHSENFTSELNEQYSAIAAQTSLVAVFLQDDGGGVDDGGAERLEVHRFPSADPLRAEWSVIVLGPNHAAMLTARLLPSPGGSEWFEFVLTHTRDIVIKSALSLATRL